LSFKNRQKPLSFSDLERLEDNFHFLEAQCKILNVRFMSLEKSFQELKTEFDNLTNLCARTIIKDNRR
jgi:hypothetical protein